MNTTIGDAVTLGAGVVAAVVAAPRWLRVAQREHYLAGSVSRFAARWWTVSPLNAGLIVVGVAAVAASAAVTPVAIVGAAVALVAPVGLRLRGTSSPLRWTARLRTLAAVAGGLVAVVVAAAAAGGWAGAGTLRAGALVSCLAALSLPLVVDAALVLTRPFERRRMAPFLRQARARLDRVRPTVVAITGSYGKTSTKGYVAHLLSATRTVVPSPRSYNNRGGLATAINQHLTPGTEVFVAEMGTYGVGEIAELCELVPPDVSVITAIGPVHLERMGSEERIAEAKSEILERAPVVVLNIDHPLLAAVADRAQAAGKRVWRVTANPVATPPAPAVMADASDGDLSMQLRRGGDAAEEPLVARGLRVPPTNVACAVAVAVELGVPVEKIAARLDSLPTAEHRLTITRGSGEQVIIDDTYNANPAGARAALTLLAQEGSRSGHRVVVTPGMVELGARQDDENEAFAAAAAAIASHLVVVGATNARALLRGASTATTEVIHVTDRAAAVSWVQAHTGGGDAVLYENDLPDHYP